MLSFRCSRRSSCSGGAAQAPLLDCCRSAVPQYVVPEREREHSDLHFYRNDSRSRSVSLVPPERYKCLPGSLTRSTSPARRVSQSERFSTWPGTEVEMGRLDDLEERAMTLEEYKALTEKEKRQLVAEEYRGVARKPEDVEK